MRKIPRNRTLTPIQRMLKAMAYLKPDKVPVLFFPEFDLMADMAEMKVKEYLHNVDAQMETGEKFKERFSDAYCAVSIYQPYATAEALGCKLMEPKDLIPSVIEHSINDVSELEDFSIPDDVWDVPGTGDWLKKIEYALEHDYQSAGVGEFGPLEVAGQVFGYDKLMIGMRRYPDKIHDFL